MTNENEYDQKFSSLIQALQKARMRHQYSPPETLEQTFTDWEKLKEEFNHLIGSHRPSRRVKVISSRG